MFRVHKSKQLANFNQLRVLGCVPAANLHRKIKAGQSYSHQQQPKDWRALRWLALCSAFGTTAAIMMKQQGANFAEADSNNQDDDDDDDKNILQQKYEEIQRISKEQFKIPLLLQEREQQKQDEYDQRKQVDVRGLGMNEEDLQVMKELDYMYGGSTTQQELREMEEETARMAVDPFLKKKQRFVKDQQFRTITVGPADLLKNGQKIQVSVCDALDEEFFHPTDKIILLKHEDSYLALGSFCGYDFTSLSQGAFLGEKLICPTCGSNYDVSSGFVETGPNFRNLSTFPVKVRDGMIEVTVPEHIPAFARKKFLKRETIDPRTFVILGDNETALGAIDALRTNFTGRIIMIPSTTYGAFQNVDIMKRDLSPLSKNQCYLVETDYLDRANVDIIKGNIKMLDVENGKLVVTGYRKPISFDKVLVAWGAHR
jgi:3-phenylpropionate/trans-cinnamate dioxygenase ferredoxin subunit